MRNHFNVCVEWMGKKGKDSKEEIAITFVKATQWKYICFDESFTSIYNCGDVYARTFTMHRCRIIVLPYFNASTIISDFATHDQDYII